MNENSFQKMYKKKKKKSKKILSQKFTLDFKISNL